jgi:hypothetical protein
MIQVDLTNQTEKCVKWIQNHVFENTELHLESVESHIIYIQFENLKDLTNINCTNLKLVTEFLLLNAEKEVLIDDNVNLKEILKLVSFSKTRQAPIIQIRNILGFNQYTNHKKAFVIADYDINFEAVKFDFYLNKTLITKEMCKHENFYGKLINYFPSATKICFNNDVSYSGEICPYVFLNTPVTDFAFFQITNSLIFKNRLEFINIDDDIPLPVGLNIPYLRYLEFIIAFEELSTRLLYPQIFKRINILQISGSPYKFQTNLFEGFTDLEYIFFKFDNLEKILHDRAAIEWISYLNRDLKINYTNVLKVKEKSEHLKIVQFEKLFIPYLTRSYNFPDEDLCLFEKFPHEQLIIPSLVIAEEKFTCSCTIIWLIQNYKIYSKVSTLNSKLRENYELVIKNLSVYRCLNNFSVLFDSCNFDKKFYNCIKPSKSISNHELSVLNIFFLFKWLKLVIDVYLKAFFSILGLITNFLILMVIKNKKFKKIFDNIMYRHAFYNSIFNFIFCFMNSFSLINICIFAKNSFCSSVYKTSEAQYFRIIFILYLGNAIRLCCNFSFIFFVISRFYITNPTNSKLFLIIRKSNLKLFYLLMFGVCLIWSIFKLFEYKPNESYSNFDKNFPFNRYDNRYCQHTDNIFNNFYKLFEVFPQECKVFPILNFINNIFNNILFLFINVVMDIFLIRFANKNYQNKKNTIHDQKHLNEAIEHKKKIRNLVITNGILYFFSHIPQFVSTVLLISFKKELEFFCYFYFSCTEMNDLFETFGFISMSLQFFVYKHFDDNFYKSFRDTKERLVRSMN